MLWLGLRGNDPDRRLEIFLRIEVCRLKLYVWICENFIWFLGIWNDAIQPICPNLLQIVVQAYEVPPVSVFLQQIGMNSVLVSLLNIEPLIMERDRFLFKDCFDYWLQTFAAF